MLWKHDRANWWRHLMLQTAIRPRNISNHNVLGCHEINFGCLLGRPGAPNQKDFHAFLNIRHREFVKNSWFYEQNKLLPFRFLLNHGRANRRQQLRNCSQETFKYCFWQVTEHHLNPNPKWEIHDQYWDIPCLRSQLIPDGILEPSNPEILEYWHFGILKLCPFCVSWMQT